MQMSLQSKMRYRVSREALAQLSLSFYLHRQRSSLEDGIAP